MNDETILTKTCNSCLIPKLLSEFYSNKNGFLGVKSICKECEKKYKIEYGRNNKEKISSKNKKYYESNKNNLKKVKWCDVSEKTKIGNRLRCRLRNALKGKIKSESTWELIGLSMNEFKEYIESKFTEGMTWDLLMKGEIHIDHKIPCNNFDLSDISQQKLCFNYTNLQPLWAKDNLIKNKF